MSIEELKLLARTVLVAIAIVAVVGAWVMHWAIWSVNKNRPVAGALFALAPLYVPAVCVLVFL